MHEQGEVSFANLKTREQVAAFFEQYVRIGVHSVLARARPWPHRDRDMSEFAPRRAQPRDISEFARRRAQPLLGLANPLV